MYFENPFFESVDHKVLVWHGDLNVAELGDYLEEPGGAGENEPISKFCVDVGRWYDHDFIWAQAHDEDVTIRKLCELNGMQPLEFVAEIEEHGGGVMGKCILVLWNAERLDDSPRLFAGGRLRCIGCWERESPYTD